MVSCATRWAKVSPTGRSGGSAGAARRAGRGDTAGDRHRLGGQARRRHVQVQPPGQPLGQRRHRGFRPGEHHPAARPGGAGRAQRAAEQRQFHPVRRRQTARPALEPGHARQRRRQRGPQPHRIRSFGQHRAGRAGRPQRAGFRHHALQPPGGLASLPALHEGQPVGGEVEIRGVVPDKGQGRRPPPPVPAQQQRQAARIVGRQRQFQHQPPRRLRRWQGRVGNHLGHQIHGIRQPSPAGRAGTGSAADARHPRRAIATTPPPRTRPARRSDSPRPGA